MRKWQLLGSVQLAVALSLAGAGSVAAQESGQDVDEWASGRVDESEQPIHPSTPHPATTVSDWVAQIEASLVQITGVRVETTETGLQLVLETAEGRELATPATQTVGNALIAEIPNAVLALPEGGAFEQFGPAEGIALVSVTNEPGDRVRAAITGTDAPPVAEVTATGLVVTLGEAVVGAEDEAIQVVVTGEQDEGYNPSAASVGSRTDTPLRDIPQSIQVIPQELIEDRQPRDLLDALRSVPGISQGQASTSINALPIIRGFSATTDVLRDGTRFPGDRALNIFDSATVDRIEVLRGPASILYGQGSLGGIINIVSKEPLPEPFYSVDVAAGNFNFYQGAVDLSGPLNSENTLLYRINLAARTNESFLDFFERQQFTVAPVISWQISDRTNLRLSAEYINASGSNGQAGLPAAGTILPNPNGEIPRNRNLSEPSLDRDDVESFRVGYNLEHRLSDTWQLHSIFEAAWQDFRRGIVFISGLEADSRTVSREFSEGPENSKIFNFNNYAISEFSTGGIQHQLLFGFNYTRSEQFSSEISPRNLPSIDIFSPVYNPTLGTQLDGFPQGELSSNTYGFYIQDQISLADNLKLVLNGRFDVANQRLISPFGTGETEFAQQNVFSPRVGLVYQPIHEISLYANYGRSFQPIDGVFSTILPQPEFGTLYEVGVKADINERLSATVALYDQTRTNILTSDPNDPFRSIQVGAQNSRGVEFNISGELSPGWSLVAGYAYTDARVSEDNNLPVGNRIPFAPENSFNLWTTYRIQEGSLRGLGIGLGLFYEGERQGDITNTFQLPDYLRTDAAIFYERDQFRAGLNFRNLFNVDYFPGALNINRVFPGDPFEVRGTVSWRF